MTAEKQKGKVKMKTETKHTPTPWVQDNYEDETGKIKILIHQEGYKGNGWIADMGELFDKHLGRDSNKANAKLIVRAVNNFEALLEACKIIVDEKESTPNKDVFEVGRISIERARQAIQQAEAEG